MATNRRALSILPLALGLGAAACSAPSVRVQAGYIQTELSGDATLEATVGATNARANADIEGGLNLGDPIGSLYVRGEVDAGFLRVSASGFRYENAASGTLDGSFGDIQGGAAVDSEIDIGVLKGILAFDLLDSEVFRLAPGIGVDVFDFRAAITEPLTGIRESLDGVIPVPMIFVEGDLNLGPVNVGVDVGGMDVTYEDFGGTFWDVEAIVSIEPIDHVELFAGYRWITLDVAGDDDDDRSYALDLALQGWFLGGGARF